MIKVHISGNRADVIEREPLTSGTVGKVLNFAFTEDWRLLIKYAVFEGSGRRIALTNIGESCIIPHEVLAKHGGALRVGVYGRTADGSAATPTVYAQLGIIQRGADPNADPSTKPTLPVWAQLQAQIGDLSNLTTEDKTNLVAAINEAAKSGGSGSGGAASTGIESITYKGEDESGGNMYTVLLTDGTSYDITAPKGAKGDKGDPGVPGKTPVKGTDYWTAADKQEIIDDIHPAYYIDLAGEYPNYTCSVAMGDIKAAYNSGYNLVCRCTLGAYTATLPLFVPMPDFNTWIFSGSGALTAMSFHAQSLTIAIVNGTVQASNTRLATLDDIPNADLTLGLTGATVGQIAKIAAVDASGAPTAWSPADMPSGGGGETEYELVFSDEIQEDIGSYYRNTDMNGETFSLTDVAVVIFTKAFAESTNKVGRNISFVETGAWGRNSFSLSNSVPKADNSFGIYDVMRVKLVNGYQIRTQKSISQNSVNVFGAMEEDTKGGQTLVQFLSDQEKLFFVSNPKGFITCIKIVGYATPLISAGSVIKLYKRKGT